MIACGDGTVDITHAFGVGDLGSIPTVIVMTVVLLFLQPAVCACMPCVFCCQFHMQIGVCRSRELIGGKLPCPDP